MDRQLATQSTQGVFSRQLMVLKQILRVIYDWRGERGTRRRRKPITEETDLLYAR